MKSKIKTKAITIGDLVAFSHAADATWFTVTYRNLTRVWVRDEESAAHERDFDVCYICQHKPQNG